jgi:hypothetical protein
MRNQCRKGKGQLVYLEISEKAALKLIFKNESVRVWTEVISLVIWTSEKILRIRLTFEFHTRLGIYRLADFLKVYSVPWSELVR